MEELRRGDRRMIGAAVRVARRVLLERNLLADLVDGLSHNDPVIRTRASYVIEKVSRDRATWLENHADALIDALASSPQSEVQWHLIQALGRLSWNAQEVPSLVEMIKAFLESSRSNIVRVSALQALFDLSQQHAALQPLVSDLVVVMATHRAPSIRARARLLRKKLYGATA